MTSERMRRHFASLGAAPDVPEQPGSIAEESLLELVESCARLHGITFAEAVVTRRLRRVAQDFARTVHRELMTWTRKHRAWMAIAVDGEDLFLDDGPYAVLMTLRGDSAGDITDGRWEMHFKKDAAKRALAALKRHLLQRLRRWSSDGAGVLEEALLESAEASKAEDRFAAQTHVDPVPTAKRKRVVRDEDEDEDDEDDEDDDEDDDLEADNDDDLDPDDEDEDDEDDEDDDEDDDDFLDDDED